MNHLELLKEYIKIEKRQAPPIQSDMVEFELPEVNKNGFSIGFIPIANLYCKVLQKDENWHFFNEGRYSLIRCSKTFAKKVEDFLIDCDVMYVGPRPWIEGTYVTVKFQNEFKKYFHWVSEMVMKLYFDEEINKYCDYYIKACAERIIHTFFNHCSYIATIFGKELDYLGNMQTWESNVVAKIALARAEWAGRYIYSRELSAKCLNENTEKNGE